MKCRHLQTTEAYAGHPGDWTAVPCFLCAWPGDGRFEGAPSWVGKKIGGGYPVDPKAECPVCPAFEASTGEEQ